MKANQLLNLCVGMGMLTLTACMEQSVYDPAKDPNAPKPETEYFDFATTKTVAVEVDYGELGSNALLEIFIEDPLSYNEYGSFVINGEPVFKIFADKNGRFVGNVEMPAMASTVYVFSPTWGVPMCIETEVVDGKVRVNSAELTAQEAVDTRANATLKLETLSSKNKLYSIVGIGNRYGKPNDFNGLLEKGDLTSTFINNVQNALWKGKTSKPDGLNNSNLVRGTEYINTSIATTYKNSAGETVVVEDAEIYFTFISESGSYQSSVGYYYYKTDECPASPANLEKFIILPNASIGGNDPFNSSSKSSTKYTGNAPLSTNQKVQLLFKDSNGKLTTQFPAGYTIGYFVMANAFSQGKSSNSKGSINVDVTPYYSNAEWNAKYNGSNSRFISLATSAGTVIYGLEDGTDTGYEDILFSIDASPNEVIQNIERPVVDEEKPEITETEKNFYTFAYEDIWPRGGDYDLNDIVVEFSRSITFGSDNYVKEVKDVYKSIQGPNAAKMQNAFAVQYPANQRGSISLPTGAIDETATSSIIVFTDGRKAGDAEYVVTRTFGDKALLKSNLKSSLTDLNPFIIAGFEGAGIDNRTEVHLPKYKATTMADPDQIGSGDDAYYVNKDGKHPFAICIPDKFIPTTEFVAIEKEYPDFTKWVDSFGATNTDWYKNYTGPNKPAE